MGTEERGYSDLAVVGWGIKLGEDRVCTTTDTLYSSSEVSLISDGPLLVLRPDGRSGVTGDRLAPDHDLRTESRLRPFRNRSKLSRTRAAALAFAAFFSTTFLARDGGLDRCVVAVEEPERV